MKLFYLTIEILIQFLSVVFFIPALLICLYYLFLALVALIPKRVNRPTVSNPVHTFAIIIPAHNEEKTISNVLHSCAGFNYPKDKYEIFVVADNCLDRTAEFVQESGVNCLERTDEKHRGKGFALEWVFTRVLPKGYDAIIVLDADCILDKHALQVFDQYLLDGDDVLQARYIVSNPDETTISYVLAIGNLIENNMFYHPKSRLGLSVFLRGTGMVFRSSILKRYPWRAHSIVEDVEYTLHLIRNGIKVKFVADVSVLSKFPANQSQLSVQRRRWAEGNLGFGKTYAFKLILEGILKSRLMLVDAGWSLLVLSRPLVLSELFITVALSAFSVWISPGVFSNGLFLAVLVLILTLGIYFGLGILLLGITPWRVILLAKAPSVVIRLITISFLGIIRGGQGLWARTPRT